MGTDDVMRPRARAGGASSLPRLRLDLAVVLLVSFFFAGVYMAGFVGIGGGGGLHARSGAAAGDGRALFRTGGGGAGDDLSGAAVDLPALQARVEKLAAALAAAEKETAAVFEENQRLRLDNKVEQANLKSLTKAKNDEIKGLRARLDELEKAGTGGGGLEGKTKELEAAQGRNRQLEKELAELKVHLKRAQDAAGSGGGSKKEGGKEVKGAASAAAAEGRAAAAPGPKGKDGFMSMQLISVPEPQPLNSHWQPVVKELFDLAQSNPAALLKKLDEEDPLGVAVADPGDFACPSPEARLTQPDLRRMEIAANFREGKGFVFFQHLRKAGGTGFCDLAQRNMPGACPSYYCMPDDRGTLATPPWNTSWLLATMAGKGYRIAANEWDAFPRSKFAMADAVFATTMRDPTDRWYSQYRFEHLEHRDNTAPGHERPFKEWYMSQVGANMGRDYYVKTFAGGENRPDAEVVEKVGPKGVPLVHGNFYWTYDKYRGKGAVTWEVFSHAVDTLRRFHVVLALEWLDHSQGVLEAVLGWAKGPRQVLPHQQQAKRADKRSKPARELLPAADFAFVREDNVLDHLFHHVGRRIFLERHACGAV